jgi:hypothetical protein
MMPALVIITILAIIGGDFIKYSVERTSKYDPFRYDPFSMFIEGLVRVLWTAVQLFSGIVLVMIAVNWIASRFHL